MLISSKTDMHIHLPGPIHFITRTSQENLRTKYKRKHSIGVNVTTQLPRFPIPNLGNDNSLKWPQICTK